MNTLEMIKDWKDSNYKKKYITKSAGGRLPYTAYNNGVGVLFESFFVITIHEPMRKSEPFTINKDNLEWEWEQIKEEYLIKESIDKTSNGDSMISLASGRLLDLEGKFTREEVMGKWIERY